MIASDLLIKNSRFAINYRFRVRIYDLVLSFTSFLSFLINCVYIHLLEFLYLKSIRDHPDNREILKKFFISAIYTFCPLQTGCKFRR